MDTSSVVDLKKNGTIPHLKHFACVDPHVDIAPLLDELKRNEEAFSFDLGRQKALHEHSETESIFLRRRTFSVYPGLVRNGDIQTTYEDVAITARLPRLYAFITEFARKRNGDLGMITIARLKPNKPVYPHIDAGKYYDLRDRYHLVVQSPAGSLLKSGGETVRMHEGELWWFDNHSTHESFNEGGDWRTHVIFDVLPASKRRAMAMILLRQRLKLLLSSNKKLAKSRADTSTAELSA